MRPDKIHHRNLFRRTVIHCPSTSQHGRRHLLQRLVQNRQQHRIFPAYGKGISRRLRQKHAAQLSVVSKLRHLHRNANHAGCLTAAHRLLHSCQRIIFHKLPLRIIISNLPLQNTAALFSGHDICRILIKEILRRINHQRRCQSIIGQQQAVLLSNKGIRGEMEEHIYFIFLERLRHILLLGKAHQLKPQSILAQTILGIIYIIVDNADNLARISVYTAERTVIFQIADADRAMLLQPSLLICRQHGAAYLRIIALIKLIHIKRLVIIHLAHSGIQLLLQIRTALVDNKINARGGDSRYREHPIFFPIRRLNRNKAVQLVISEQLPCIIKALDIHVLYLQIMLRLPLVKRLPLHAAMQYAHALAVHGA